MIEPSWSALMARYKKLILADDMILADNFFQRLRPHLGRKRFILFLCLSSGVFK
jgi:hypothetical protein